MKEIVLITGGTGFVGKQLEEHLQDEFQLKFLTRGKSRGNFYHWDIGKGIIDPDALVDVDHIVHLAGSSVADKRWTKKRKEDILYSRVNSAELIMQELANRGQKICAFISASGTGYYGSEKLIDVCTEQHGHGNDFLSSVCEKWEQSAKAFQTNNIAERSVCLRIGVVLGKNGGALEKISAPIKARLGSSFGDGKQFMPWIHLEDLCQIMHYCLSNNTSGVFNAVASQHSTNAEMTKAIGTALNKRILLPNVPGFILKLALGELSVILLSGNRVSGQKIIDHGYEFRFANLKSALDDIYKE